jgi:hypothetical protein
MRLLQHASSHPAEVVLQLALCWLAPSTFYAVQRLLLLLPLASPSLAAAGAAAALLAQRTAAAPSAAAPAAAAQSAVQDHSSFGGCISCWSGLELQSDCIRTQLAFSKDGKQHITCPK